MKLLSWLLLASFLLSTAFGQKAVTTIEKIGEQAKAAREANKMDEAIALYKKGLTLKPSWEEGWWYLGTLYYDLDYYNDGMDAFRHVTVLNPKVAVGWAMLGLCEYQTKAYDRALVHLRQGVDLGLGQDEQISDVAHYHLALLLTRFGDFENSMKILSLFAQRNLNKPGYVEAMGIASLRKPLLPSEVPPAERELIMDVGRTMYDATALKTSEAASDFKLLLDKYPTQPGLHYLYGSFLMFSDAAEGLNELKKELTYSPNHLPALVTIGSEYIKLGDFKGGLSYAEKAVQLDGRSFPAHAVLGQILAEGDIDPARGIQELEVAKQIAPGSPQVRIALAKAYAKDGRKDDAARERQEFLKLRKATDEANQAQP